MQAKNTLLNGDGPLVTAIRASLPNSLAVYAFGSQVQGTQGVDSDLDLAVLVGGYADPLTLWTLSSQLADTAGCPVDLLDLRATTTRSLPRGSVYGRPMYRPVYLNAMC